MHPEPNFPVRPEEFIGRRSQIEAFRQCLRQGLLTGRTPSFAVLGDWGIGKSSLLLKYATFCTEPDYAILPVLLSVSNDLGDYLRFSQSLLGAFVETLEASTSLLSRFRVEIQNWKPKRLSFAGFAVDREAPQFFLSSGSALLRHTLRDAWNRFLRPASIRGVVFFLDDLHNFAGQSPETIALLLRDQFQSFAIEGANYSLCFSARPDYFSTVRDLAEPAVRFFDKVYLAPFTLSETAEYTDAVFEPASTTSHGLSRWLHEKTLGHPYFLAFVCRQLLAIAQGSPLANPAQLWPEIFSRLEQEKFRVDLAQAPDREVQLLHAIASAPSEEVTPAQMGHSFDRVHFSRVAEKGLLIRTGRGRYKLYHPLFKLFLQGLKP